MTLFKPRRSKEDLTWLESATLVEVAIGRAPFAARGLGLLHMIVSETCLKCADRIESNSLNKVSAPE